MTPFEEIIKRLRKEKQLDLSQIETKKDLVKSFDNISEPGQEHKINNLKKGVDGFWEVDEVQEFAELNLAEDITNIDEDEVQELNDIEEKVEELVGIFKKQRKSQIGQKRAFFNRVKIRRKRGKELTKEDLKRMGVRSTGRLERQFHLTPEDAQEVFNRLSE